MNIKFEVGSVVSNDDIMDVFKVNRQGGMRRSLSTNTLVLTLNHVKAMYDDRWEGGILHYTGMGLKDDAQKFERGNKTLRDAYTQGIKVHLFEVFKNSEYTYRGEVYLCDEPYFEMQYNKSEKCDRQVIVFPLRLVADRTLSDGQNTFEIFQESSLLDLPEQKIRKKIEDTHPGDEDNTHTMKSVKDYKRDPWVKALARKLAIGRCRLCDSRAPFQDNLGHPFLEVHHVIPLSKGGSDTIDNVVALCPNCHRKVHIVEKQNDFEKLRKIAMEQSKN